MAIACISVVAREFPILSTSHAVLMQIYFGQIRVVADLAR